MIAKGFQKAFNDFSNQIFPIENDIINLFDHIWEFYLFINMLNFNEPLEIWWRYEKSHMILITILVFLKNSM